MERPNTAVIRHRPQLEYPSTMLTFTKEKERDYLRGDMDSRYVRVRFGMSHYFSVGLAVRCGCSCGDLYSIARNNARNERSEMTGIGRIARRLGGSRAYWRLIRITVFGTWELRLKRSRLGHISTPVFTVGGYSRQSDESSVRVPLTNSARLNWLLRRW